MCEYCGRRIHAPGCPNEEELFICAYCKSGILSGDRCIEVADSRFHEDCFFDFLSCINEDDILRLFDLKVETA